MSDWMNELKCCHNVIIMIRMIMMMLMFIIIIIITIFIGLSFLKYYSTYIKNTNYWERERERERKRWVMYTQALTKNKYLVKKTNKTV